jgi:aminoglycoside phosphotransferase (APT) family kinase protein
MSADADARVADALLRYLSETLGRPDLAYADAPVRITGGFDTAIFGFSLAHAPAHLGAQLILRLGRPAADPMRFVLEAVVQNALAAMAFPAPRVHLTQPSKAVLGGPFLIMQRLAGRPLAHDVEGLGADSSLLEKLRGIAGLPSIFRRISTTWAETQIQLHDLAPGPVLKAVSDAGLDERIITFDGQLARLSAAITAAGLSELMPVMSWLEANHPGRPQRACICHGDFHPLNIMADAGRITGVIDWANVVVAQPEMDVGSAIANISTAPFAVPASLRPVLRLVIRSALGSYLRAYRIRRPLDEVALRYFQVFRAFAQLGWAAIAQRAGRAGSGAFASEAGMQNLIGFIADRSGVEVKLQLANP